jgi:hypothetical protein
MYSGLTLSVVMVNGLLAQEVAEFSLSETGPGRGRCKGAPEPDALRPDGGRRVCSYVGPCAQIFLVWSGVFPELVCGEPSAGAACVMRCAGPTGCVVGVRSSPGNLSGSLYTSLKRLSPL